MFNLFSLFVSWGLGGVFALLFLTNDIASLTFHQLLATSSRYAGWFSYQIQQNVTSTEGAICKVVIYYQVFVSDQSF